MTGSNTHGTTGRRRLLGGGAVAVVALVAALALRSGAMELSLGAGGAMASCLAFDVERLAEMPVAFAGTVTDAGGETAVLAVDRWFRGGEADEVLLRAPAGLKALTGGFELVPGDRYLITATDGTVNYCGFSGPATPELTTAYDAAFPR